MSDVSDLLARQERNRRIFTKAVWRSARWGWLAEISSPQITCPITGWGSTWRPTERMAHAWADRRIARHLAAVAREDAREEAHIRAALAVVSEEGK